MPAYYVNQIAQQNGDHEVHRFDCAYMPDAVNRQHLGDFTTCAPAVREARKFFHQSNGCHSCSPQCHTS
jgi:hypothetical protein